MAKKTMKTQKLPESNLPADHPEAVARMADAMPWKTTARNFAVGEYIDAICKLRTRGYSYADTANWLTERLAEKLGGKKITRGQVYRVYQQSLELQDPLNVGLSVTNIDDQDAEVQAEIIDKKARESAKEEPS
jgi:hypothetical protein